MGQPSPVSPPSRTGQLLAFVGLIDRALTVCEGIFLVLANACVAVMMLINIVNIFLRHFFSLALASVYPWSVVLMVWMTFLGFFLLYRWRRDVTIDFLVDHIGRQARFATRLLVNAIIFVILGVILWHAAELIEAQQAMIELVGLKRRVLTYPLVAACIALVLDTFVDTVHAFHGIEERQPVHH
jgi:TRAP-type C4-dicarboxylate transport system permease small subunit